MALLMPETLKVLKAGYNKQNFISDILAGLTVAVVALPLSMAIAIASGMTPAQGLYTSIIGGFLVSALGGSRFQIGGTAGAFIVLVSTTAAAHGVSGVILTTLISGIFLTLLGIFRLGRMVAYIPFPVMVGFTAGIAGIIFISQIKSMTGITLSNEPASFHSSLAGTQHSQSAHYFYYFWNNFIHHSTTQMDP